MMLIALSVVIATLCAVLVCRIDIPNHYRPTRAPWLLALAGGIQLALLTPLPPTPAVFGSVVCALGWMVCNVTVPGMPLLMVGASMNGVAMALHGGRMPLAPSIAERWGVGTAGTLVPGTKTVVGGAHTFHWFSDAIPLLTPWGRYAASIGDVLVLLALVYWVAALRLRGIRAHERSLSLRNIQ